MKLFLFLDYDGTLSPIVRRPEKAKLKSSQRKLLKKISLHKNVFMTIISGRALSDVKKKVNLPGILYVGNHGLEIDGKGIKWKHPKIASSTLLHNEILKILKIKTEPIKGVIVEDKKPIVAIHYRLVKKVDLPKLRKIISLTLKSYQHKVKIKNGKKVIEIWQKINWDKGQAALKVLKLFGKGKYLPIHIGDDKTDEDVFKVLKNKGFTIKVGLEGNTLAHTKIKDVTSVYNFLQFLLDMLES